LIVQVKFSLPVPAIRRFATRAESMTCVKFFSKKEEQSLSVVSKNIELFHSLSSDSIESNNESSAIPVMRVSFFTARGFLGVAHVGKFWY